MHGCHIYLLRNRKDTTLEVRSEGVVISCLDPGATVYFFSPYGDLEPLFSSEGVDCSIDSFVDVDPEFLLKCKTIEKTEPGIWKQEGF